MDSPIHNQDSPLCRAGSYCRDATYGPHPTSDGWQAAATTAPDTLCDRCIAAIAAAVAGLWQDYLGLGQLVIEPSTGPTSEIRSPSPTPSLPIDIHDDALKVELETVVGHAAAAISDNPPQAFVTAVTLVEDNLDVLLRAPRHPVVMWNRSGDQRVRIDVDGIDIALKLSSLHRRARMILGVDRGKDRMPVPCPRCEARKLVRFHGEDGVLCEACLGRWTDDDYRYLTMIGAGTITPATHERTP